jgi:hypothetical protein
MRAFLTIPACFLLLLGILLFVRATSIDVFSMGLTRESWAAAVGAAGFVIYALLLDCNGFIACTFEPVLVKQNNTINSLAVFSAPPTTVKTGFSRLRFLHRYEWLGLIQPILRGATWGWVMEEDEVDHSSTGAIGGASGRRRLQTDDAVVGRRPTLSFAMSRAISAAPAPAAAPHRQTVGCDEDKQAVRPAPALNSICSANGAGLAG